MGAHHEGCCGGDEDECGSNDCTITEGLVLVQPENGVALVTLNRPDKLNALSAEVLQQLHMALVGIEADESVGALVLTGHTATKRPAFAAGADIAEMVSMTGLEMRQHSQLGQAVFSMLEQLSKPSIAAVNGFAFGGGMELTMACHLRFASEVASFGQPEINLGIVPGFAGSQRLPRLVGQGRALEMLLSGEPINAAEALRIGLVNRVFPEKDLVQGALDFARKLAQKAPVARAAIIDLVVRGAGLTLERAMATEADSFGLVGGSEDVKEGMKAFLEKRPPQWTGR
jgi:enoyl-CoA hydratase